MEMKEAGRGRPCDEAEEAGGERRKNAGWEEGMGCFTVTIRENRDGREMESIIIDREP